MESFDKVQKAIDLNYLFLEQLLVLDYQNIAPSERGYLFSEMRKSIRILLSLLEKHG